MSPQQKRQITVGLVTTLLGLAIVGIFGAARQSVVLRAEYETTVQRLDTKDVSLDRDISDVREITLEVLCEVKPTSRKCGR